MTPETSDEYRDPAAKDLAGAEKVATSKDALEDSECLLGTPMTIAPPL